MAQTSNPDLVAKLDAHLSDIEALEAAVACGGEFVGGIHVRNANAVCRAFHERAIALVAEVKAAIQPVADPATA